MTGVKNGCGNLAYIGDLPLGRLFADLFNNSHDSGRPEDEEGCHVKSLDAGDGEFLVVDQKPFYLLYGREMGGFDPRSTHFDTTEYNAFNVGMYPECKSAEDIIDNLRSEINTK